MEPEFSSVADDFFVNVNLQTTLALPTGRETILHFCEAVQREFAAMTSFYQRDSGEFVLEGDHEAGSYPWLELESHRLSSGYFAPPELRNAYHLHRWLLNRCVYFLGISPLDVDSLDVLFAFNLDYKGNRDEILAEALLANSPLWAFLGDAGGQPLECEPAVVVALDEACGLQARLSLETRSSSYQVRTGQYTDDPISVYLTVRRYPTPGEPFDIEASFGTQSEICEDLTCRTVIPNVVQPIAAAIAAAQ
jgi:hypothetical protein